MRVALLLWLAGFRKNHKAARLAFDDGNRDVEFPLGTYLHAKVYGVNCSAVGPPAIAPPA